MRYLKLIVPFLFISVSAFSQLGPPPPGPPPTEGQIPITDHIEILVAAGILLGIYTIIRSKKRSQIKKLSKITK